MIIHIDIIMDGPYCATDVTQADKTCPYYAWDAIGGTECSLFSVRIWQDHNGLTLRCAQCVEAGTAPSARKKKKTREDKRASANEQTRR